MRGVKVRVRVRVSASARIRARVKVEQKQTEWLDFFTLIPIHVHFWFSFYDLYLHSQ